MEAGEGQAAEDVERWTARRSDAVDLTERCVGYRRLESKDPGRDAVAPSLSGRGVAHDGGMTRHRWLRGGGLVTASVLVGGARGGLHGRWRRAGTFVGAIDRGRESSQAGLDGRLRDAAWADDVAAARGLVAQGADVDATDETQQSAYLVATSEGFLELLELTLAAGADVDAKDSWNGTGLIRAAERGHHLWSDGCCAPGSTRTT